MAMHARMHAPLLLPCGPSMLPYMAHVCAHACPIAAPMWPMYAPIYGHVCAHACPIAALMWPIYAPIYGPCMRVCMPHCCSHVAHICPHIWPMYARMHAPLLLPYGPYMRACPIAAPIYGLYIRAYMLHWVVQRLGQLAKRLKRQALYLIWTSAVIAHACAEQ